MRPIRCDFSPVTKPFVRNSAEGLAQNQGVDGGRNLPGKRELKVWRRVLGHAGTPRVAKGLLWFGISYALMPFDLIPDFIPVLGFVDDLVLVAVPIALALKLVPRAVVAECRAAPPETAAPPAR